MRTNVKKVNASMMTNECATFLRKYGRLEYCDEFDTVAALFKSPYEIHFKEEFEHPLARARLLKL